MPAEICLHPLGVPEKEEKNNEYRKFWCNQILVHNTKLMDMMYTYII
jgi:hypothetical protein